jgi:hypothetical protein
LTAWHRFPYGRKRRDVILNDIEGPKVERYNEEVKVVGTTDLKSNDLEDDEYVNEPFEDEFEEEDEELESPENKHQDQELPDSFKENDRIPPSSRWATYDSFSRLLDEYELNVLFIQNSTVSQ